MIEDILRYIGPVSLAIVIIFTAKKETTNPERKKVIKWLVLGIAVFGLVAIIASVWLDDRNDRKAKEANESLRASYDTLTQLLKRNGLNTDSLRELLAEQQNKKVPAVNVEQKALVSVFYDSLYVTELRPNYYITNMGIRNYGPGHASQVRVQIFWMNKIDGLFHQRPKQLADTWKSPRNMPNLEWLNAKGEFTIVTGGLKPTDTAFFRIKYQWDNPERKQKFPVYEYVYWTTKNGIRVGEAPQIFTVESELKKWGIK